MSVHYHNITINLVGIPLADHFQNELENYFASTPFNFSGISSSGRAQVVETSFDTDGDYNYDESTYYQDEEDELYGVYSITGYQVTFQVQNTGIGESYYDSIEEICNLFNTSLHRLRIGILSNYRITDELYIDGQIPFEEDDYDYEYNYDPSYDQRYGFVDYVPMNPYFGEMTIQGGEFGTHIGNGTVLQADGGISQDLGNGLTLETNPDGSVELELFGVDIVDTNGNPYD